jgi:hypothetical protein
VKLPFVSLSQGLWLAIDEVIHHNDILFPNVIRPRGNATGCDPDSRDARIIEHDSEEGLAPIARRGWDEAAEYARTELVEVLDQRAGAAVSVFRTRAAAVWQVNACEDRSEAPDRCCDTTIGTWYKEQGIGNVTSHRGGQSRRTKGSENGSVGRIIEEHRQPALGSA